MNRGKLWIIPLEEVIIQPEFFSYVESGASHNSKIREFVGMYNLDVEVVDESYHGAPCVIATCGHMVVKTEDDMGQAIIYLPELVSNRQLEWLVSHQTELNTYSKIGCYSLVKREDNYIQEHLYGMFDIVREATRKNMLKAKEERKK